MLRALWFTHSGNFVPINVKRLLGAAGFLAVMLLFAVGAQAASLVMQAPDGPGLAFARYIATLQKVDRPETMGVEIEASLPDLGKSARLVAIRDGSEYRDIHLEGDAMVRQQVIARYLSAQAAAAEMPDTAVAITPANYRFRYAASIEHRTEHPAETTLVYVYEVVPIKNRVGLLKGQLWIDSATGAAVHQDGYAVKRPSVFVRRVELARDVLKTGMHVTRLRIETRLVGRAELTITERPVSLSTVEGAER